METLIFVEKNLMFGFFNLSKAFCDIIVTFYELFVLLKVRLSFTATTIYLTGTLDLVTVTCFNDQNIEAENHRLFIEKHIILVTGPRYEKTDHIKQNMYFVFRYSMNTYAQEL